MTVSELIKQLQKYDGELSVTTSDKMGGFCNLENVELQKWTKDGNKYASVTLVLARKYDSSEARLKSEKDNEVLIEIICNDDEDEEFIDNVNKELNEEEKLDKEDAMKAKKVFDEDEFDIKDIQKKYKEWFDKRYDKIAHDAMIELYGDDKPLTDKTLSELKLHVYENGWQDEIDKDEMNNRMEVMRVLYNKLDEKVKKILASDTKKLWNDVMGDDNDWCKSEDDQKQSFCVNWDEVNEAFRRFTNLFS